MVDHAALVHAVGDYAQALLTRYDIGSMLYRLTDHVTAVLGADGAGVSLGHEGRDLAFVAATDGDVAAIEEQQITSKQGPCHEAYRTGELIVVNDLEHDPRWPAYRPAAVRAGARAVLGVPMPIGHNRIGALNVYRWTTHDWDDAEVEVARALANMASRYVLNAGALERSDVLTTQLQRARDSRVIIEQAKGILAERHGIPPGRGVPATSQPRAQHPDARPRPRRADRRRHDHPVGPRAHIAAMPLRYGDPVAGAILAVSSALARDRPRCRQWHSTGRAPPGAPDAPTAGTTARYRMPFADRMANSTTATVRTRMLTWSAVRSRVGVTPRRCRPRPLPSAASPE